MKKFIRLIFVSEDNKNKYYEMSHDGTSPEFQVKYGRVDVTEQHDSYPISKWSVKYNEKKKKGYKDVTDLVAEVKADTKITLDIKDTQLKSFLQKMLDYRDGLVKSIYSVKASQITKAQIDTAQSLLDKLSKDGLDIDTINKLLLDLYQTIPRRMAKVQNHLLPVVNLKDIMEQEQDNLDAISSQFSSISDEKELNLLSYLGIEMEVCKDIPKEIKYLLDQRIGYKVKAIFSINKDKENKILGKTLLSAKNKKTKYLIHGTRCSSVIPIIEQGLKIRPTGTFQFSGKAYGDGTYFSETMQKSMGYTGYDNDKVIFVYEVHVGKPFEYDGWFRGNSFPLDYDNLSKRGYDSTYVKAGGGLLNSEIIVYTEKQYALRNIIFLQ